MHACVGCSAWTLSSSFGLALQVSYGGEDAWFTSDMGGGAIGVADGVGGWADSEINPAGAWVAVPSQRLVTPFVPGLSVQNDHTMRIALHTAAPVSGSPSSWTRMEIGSGTVSGMVALQSTPRRSCWWPSTTWRARMCG